MGEGATAKPLHEGGAGGGEKRREGRQEGVASVHDQS